MCVIISRKPNVTIPFEMLKSACHVNGDGFGLTVLDRGKLETVKSYDPKGNDPEKLTKLLTDADDHQVWLHLRFTTKGHKDVENCHPFQITTMNDDGIDSMFMHNGTLFDFNDSSSAGRSDSFVFARDLLSPLAKVYHRGLKNTNYLEDPLFKSILSKYSGGSVFCLYDQDGNELIVDNLKNGKSFEGFWASNEYSFKRDHREPAVKSTYYGYQGSRGVPFTTTGTSKTHTPGTTNTSSAITSIDRQKVSDELYEGAAIIGSAISQIKRIPKSRPVAVVPPEQRYTFVELAQLSSLEDVMHLSEEDIEDTIREAPAAAALLIMDLIYELYRKQPVEQSERQAA